MGNGASVLFHLCIALIIPTLQKYKKRNKPPPLSPIYLNICMTMIIDYKRTNSIFSPDKRKFIFKEKEVSP